MPELAQSQGFMLYPRGFLGAQRSPQIRQAPRAFSNQMSRLQPSLNFLHGPRSGDRLDVNEDVESLYMTSIEQQHSVDSFEFRRQLLMAALAAFGTPSFDFWYSQQKYSPSAGDLHKDFLSDTLKFIMDGMRTQRLETWNAVIGYSDKGERKGVLDDRAIQFFGITSNGITRSPRNGSLIDVLCQWCSQPGGMTDLLFTLHILFGAQAV